MTQRSIVGSAKTGSISRRQARDAARTVKMARTESIGAIGSTAGSKAGRLVSASALERFLGHFGGGPSGTRKIAAKKARRK